MIGAKPELSRKLTVVMNTKVWSYMSKKQQFDILKDVESGKSFKNLKKPTKDFFNKAEKELKEYNKDLAVFFK